MAQSRNHRHLLRHPTVTSFLWLKWQRVRRFVVVVVVVETPNSHLVPLAQMATSEKVWVLEVLEIQGS